MRLRVLGALAVAACVGAATSCLVTIPDVVGGGDGDEPDALDIDADLDAGDDVDDASIDVPAACSTLDASACLPSVPDGWSPVTLPAGDAGCGTDWTESDLVTNAKLSGACGCTCNTFGQYRCNSLSTTLTATTGALCANNTTLTEGICKAIATPDFGFASKPAPSGNVSCSSQTQKPTVSSNPLTMCVPTQCDVDFCSAPGEKCIESPGSVACPQGFNLVIAAESTAIAKCPTCGCTVDPPSLCDVTLTVYDKSFCSSALASTATPGSCSGVPGFDGGTKGLEFTGTYNGATTCKASGGGAATLSLGNPTTICCAN